MSFDARTGTWPGSAHHRVGENDIRRVCRGFLTESDLRKDTPEIEKRLSFLERSHESEHPEVNEHREWLISKYRAELRRRMTSHGKTR